LGDAVGLVAFILYVAEEMDSSTAVALLLVAGDFIPTLLSPFIGVVADRLERRRLLIICELGQALAIGAFVIAEPPLGVLLLLVAIGGVLATLFQAAARSAVPDLVADEDLEHANALIGGGTFGLEALGPLLAAALLPFMSPLGLLALDAVTFLVSPLLLAGLPRMLSAFRSGQNETLSVAARTGIRFIWSHQILRPVAVAFVVVVAFNGVDDLALVFLGRDILRRVTLGSACCMPRPASASSSGSRCSPPEPHVSLPSPSPSPASRSAVPATCSPACLRSSPQRSPCSWCVVSASA
jgi:MFS family permease